MKGGYSDLTAEERAEKMSQFKEMNEAFATLSESEQAAVQSYFSGMKGNYADLTQEERAAKKAELKEQMEAFMELTFG